MTPPFINCVPRSSTQVRGVSKLDTPCLAENGEIEFDAEKAAIGLGICFVQKSGNTTVRWQRVNSYLNSNAKSGIEVSSGDYISEPQLYKLAFKCIK